MDDDWIKIGSFLSGEIAAFEFIFNKYKTRVINLAFGFLRDRAAAEDTAQEVFLKIYQKKAQPDSRAKFSTWLYRVTVNASLDVLRKRKFAPVSMDRDDETSGDQGGVLKDRLPDLKSSNPGQTLEREDLALCVRGEIDRLPEKFRSVIVLYQFEDMSYREIASILAISEKAVERRLYHAREILRQHLAAYLPN